METTQLNAARPADSINYGTVDDGQNELSPRYSSLPALHELPRTSDPTILNISSGDASAVSIAFSIIKSIVGCGILSLPWSTSIIGLVPCIILMVISFIVSFICWMYLTVCAEYLRVYEYRDIGLKLYGRKFAIFLDIILIFLSCMYCILYSVYMGQFISNGLNEFGIYINTEHINNIQIHSLQNLVQTNFFIITLIIFCIGFPLTLLPKLDYLKYTSFIGIGGSLFVTSYISYVFFANDISTENTIQMINTHNGNVSVSLLYWLEAFGVYSAVFFGHFNTSPLYGELRRRSINKMFVIALVSFVIVMVLNAFMIVTSYGIFGANIQQNVIESLSDNPITNNRNIIAVLRILMSINMIGSYPLLFWNAKIALKSLLFYTDKKAQSFDATQLDASGQNLRANRRWQNIWQSNSAQRFVYFLTNVLIWIIAVFAGQVGIILSFIQATVGNLILFIFPTLFYYKLTRKWKYLNYFIIAFGLFAMLGGIVSTLLSMLGYL